MHPDVLWLVSLGLIQKLFTLNQARQVRAALGDKVELMDFAQKLIDDGIVHDVETLEKVAGLAMTKAEKGPPPVDPFDDEDEAEPMAAPATGRATGAGFAPQFPFAGMLAPGDLGGH